MPATRTHLDPTLPLRLSLQVLAVVCLLVGVASALPQFQLGADPRRPAAPPRSQQEGQRTPEKKILVSNGLPCNELRMIRFV